MFSSPSNNVYFVIILLLFTVTSVFSQCIYRQKTCYGTYGTWCCSDDETCGSDYGSCTDSSTLPPTIIAIIIVVSIFCFVTCVSCCINTHQRQQRMRAAFANSNTRVYTNSYQQQIIRTPIRVVHVRPGSRVGAAPSPHSFPSIYETAPPSYEAATATLPPVYPSSSHPPMTATVEQSGSSTV